MSVVFWDNAEDAQGPILGPGTEGTLNQSNPWDTCKLQGIHLPGIIDVRVQSKARRVQNKKSNGSDGATPTFRGQDPAKVSITVTLWTPDQLATWDALLPVIFPNPGKNVDKLSALDISHPATQQRGIKAVIIEDIAGPNDGHVKGSKQYQLACVEFVPRKKHKSATKTVVGGVAMNPAFVPGPSKNAPAPPSQTDTGPNQSFQPQQGNT